jgi:hypothetical protein
MNVHTIRRVAVALIALLVYVQGSVALAACKLDRGAMALAAAGHECCDTTDAESEPQLGNVCLAHCTANLQVFELPMALVRAPADAAVLIAPVAGADSPDPRARAASSTPVVPPRILFQSFLI